MRAPSRLSLAARFVLLGAAAFGAKWAIMGPPDRRPLTVEVPANASGAELDRAVDEAILLDVAERARLPEADAVVRERLVRSLAVVEDVSDANAAVARGVALGLHRQDVVARERLLADARELVVAGRAPPPPTDEEARAFLAAHAEAYTAPARVQFRQLFLSRERRGETLRADAAALAEALSSAGPDVVAGDAWAWTTAGGHYTIARLDALAGAGFGEQVMNAPAGKWSGPIESSFGLHFVWVTAHTPPAPPSATELSRARADLSEQERALYRAARVRALRDQYEVAWVRRP